MENENVSKNFIEQFIDQDIEEDIAFINPSYACW